MSKWTTQARASVSWIALGLGLLLLGLGSGVLFSRMGFPPSDTLPSFKANYPDFDVETAEGTLRVSQILAGKVGLVYFGYTACPDICPTTLATLGSAWKSLPEESQHRVTGLFISVDPERDSPAQASQYAAYFHPNFRGGTQSDVKRLRSIAAQWGVVFRKSEGATALGYTVDHSTQSFLVRPGSGELGSVKVLAHGTPVGEIAKIIEEELSPEGDDQR